MATSERTPADAARERLLIEARSIVQALEDPYAGGIGLAMVLNACIGRIAEQWYGPGTAEAAVRYAKLRAIATKDSGLWRALDCGDGNFTPQEFDGLVDRTRFPE